MEGEGERESLSVRVVCCCLSVYECDVSNCRGRRVRGESKREGK